MVLIALSDDGKSHFAVEREGRGLYALCKIGSWVRLNELCITAVVTRYQSHKGIFNGTELASCAQSSPAESQITPESSKYSKKKRLAIAAIQSMVKRPSRDLSCTSQDVVPVQAPYDTVLESQSQEDDGTKTQEDSIVQPTAAEILDNIRSQYFEALYLSKVCQYFWTYILSANIL